MEKQQRKPNIGCSVCGTRIYRRPCEIKAGRVFCSLACSALSQRKEVPCVVCGEPILGQFNKKTCSRACANKQRAGIKYNVGRPRDKVVSQRAIKVRLLKERSAQCEQCGYSRIEILHVHHKDRDRSNNEFSNLALICPNCHYEEHYLEKSWLGATLLP